MEFWLKPSDMLILFKLFLSALPAFAANPRLGSQCDLILGQRSFTIEEVDARAKLALESEFPEPVWDEIGLIRSRASDFAIRKVFPDLQTFRHGLYKNAQDKSHILFLSGSFDLIHRGHAEFTAIAIRETLQSLNIDRSQLFVVVTTDSDGMISRAKAKKHISFGGDEQYPRPIQSQGFFPELSVSPRALDLALLPVDAVVIVPDPHDFFLEDEWVEDMRGHLSPLELAISARAAQLNEAELKAPAVAAVLRNVEQTIEKLRAGHFESLAASYDLTAWNFLVFFYLTHGLFNSRPEVQFIRVLNEMDGDYLGHVALMKRLAGFDVSIMPTRSKGLGTTDYIRIYGALNLLERKRQYLRSSLPID